MSHVPPLNWPDARWLRLIVAVILVGVWLRFFHLDHRVFWFDEVVTAVRTAGYSSAEIPGRLTGHGVLSVEDLLRYQHVNPERGMADCFEAQAREFPIHWPIYPVLLRLWAAVFGDSVSALRAFSAAVSLLAIPCLYWLCRELFDESATGWAAVALIAVSPFHVLYAQEARAYSLWSVVTLLSSAALLRAMRVQTVRAWVLYGAAVVLGLHTQLLFGFVFLAHGAWLTAVSVTRTDRFPRALRTYLLVAVAVAVTFAPWVVIGPGRFGMVRGQMAWTGQDLATGVRLARWIRGLAAVFVDMGGPSAEDLQGDADGFAYVVDGAVLLLVVCSFAWLIRATPPRVWLFVLALAGSTFVPLACADLILDGRRATVLRYLTPLFLATQVAVAHILAISTRSDRPVLRLLGRAVTVALVALGTVSCLFVSGTEVWWNKGDPDKDNPEIVRLVNEGRHPLLVECRSSYRDVIHTLALSRRLDPKVAVQLVADAEELAVPGGFTDVFLSNPSDELRRRLDAEGYTLEEAGPPNLWRLSRRRDRR